ncbi:MAG: N-6 DNA methylase, partial [bacterium]
YMSSITDYLKQLGAALAQGDATEHTHRPALKALLELLDADIKATNEPKRQACGAPDYIIMRGQAPVGFIEAKDIGVGLDAVESGEQMGRYLPSLSNLILTDYLEFRWYINGVRVASARLATVGAHGKLHPVSGGADDVSALLQNFLKSDVPTVNDARELAGRMANLAQLLREIVEKWLTAENEHGVLHGQMAAFRESLLHDLTAEQFADMYAQTICYGLFAARINFNGQGEFTRERAPYLLPSTNPFLRDLFAMLAGPALRDEPYVWVVDNLALLLDRSDISACMEGFGRGTAQIDPVLHFYETFLAAYDPRLRELRGVYYTPEPVVSYIVRSVDQLLKSDFDLPLGLADSSSTSVDGVDVHRVLILDPATGTGTFLRRVIEQIHGTFANNMGTWNDYVSRHLLPRIFGFELLMAPYAIAHLKLALELQEMGYDINASGERLNIFLTNTLEEARNTAGQASLAYALTQEASKAGKVKGEYPVMVVLGNPPYSGHSANKGEWIKNLLHGRDGNMKSTG